MMYDKIIKKILESIEQKSALTGIYPKFSGNGYKACKIDIKNFHQIKRSALNKKIAFIDGGNAEIIGSANFSLNFIRTACVVYRNNKKASAKRSEFFALINTISHDNDIYYKASFFSLKGQNLLEEPCFSSFDHTLMLGTNRAEISSVANAIRRFAELRMAKTMSERHNFCDIIVLDGILQSTITDENKYLNELYESCSKNKVILAALSKTTSLFTDDGNLLSAILGSISALPVWFYHPIAEIKSVNHKAEMFFVKLHEKSRYVFRLEIFNEQKAKAEETINELSSNCIDPIFIGYPYGLIEADKAGRVGNEEREFLKTIFSVKLNNTSPRGLTNESEKTSPRGLWNASDKKNIENYLNSANAHEILDKISF